jgi:hypothetical protein
MRPQPRLGGKCGFHGPLLCLLSYRPCCYWNPWEDLTRVHPCSRALRALRQSAASRFAILQIGEPPSSWFEAGYSGPLNYRGKCGVPARSRTWDLRLRTPALFPLSYGDQTRGRGASNAAVHSCFFILIMIGADDRNRTCMASWPPPSRGGVYPVAPRRRG